MDEDDPRRTCPFHTRLVNIISVVSKGFMFSFSKERFWEMYQQGALVFYQQENLTQ